jgi:hypothetical protein
MARRFAMTRADLVRRPINHSAVDTIVHLPWWRSLPAAITDGPSPLSSSAGQACSEFGAEAIRSSGSMDFHVADGGGIPIKFVICMIAFPAIG